MPNLTQSIGEFIDRQSVVFIASIDSEGYPTMRALLPPVMREGIRVFYFHTNTSSQKVEQYRQNPKTSLYFCEQKNFIGLALKGEMEVLCDDASKEQFWRPSFDLYYPGGMYDNDYCILKFAAKSGRRYGGDFHSTNFIIS